MFRNGSTLNTTDLVNAACETARSIVVMSVGENSAQADANTLRVVLALMVCIRARGHRLELLWSERGLDAHPHASLASEGSAIPPPTTTHPQAVGDKLRGFVVAEVRDQDMNELLGIIGGDNVETLLTHETLARMSLSAVKQPGITKAYEEILGFEGAEFYTKDWPSLTGPSRTSVSSCNFALAACRPPPCAPPRAPSLPIWQPTRTLPPMPPR